MRDMSRDKSLRVNQASAAAISPRHCRELESDLRPLLIMLGLPLHRTSAKSVPEDYSGPKANAALPVEHRWSPYADNGGSVVAVAGEDFVVIASDTRLSAAGYDILSREQSKLFTLTLPGQSGQVVLGSTGCWADVSSFAKLLSVRARLYELNHDRALGVAGFAQLTTVMLYSKRFFPYYVSNVLAGLDEEGRGVVYSYDPVGHCEKSLHRAAGAAVALLQPLLDNLVGKKNLKLSSPISESLVRPTLSEAVDLVHDLFVSASEREIHTGDGISIRIIARNKPIEERFVALRKD